MKEIIIQLFCKTQGQICINNSKCLMLNNDNKLKLKLIINNFFLLEYKPINNSNYSPFLCRIDFTNGTLQCDSQNIYIIELAPFHYYLLILPFYSSIKASSYSQKEIISKGKKISFNGTHLQLYDKGKFKEVEICKTKTDFDLNLYNQTVILFSKENMTNNVHLFNLNNSEHIEVNCSSFILKNQEIQCIQNLKTYAHHKKIKVFNSNDLSLKDNFIGYEKQPRAILPKKIIPFAFFQNIYAEDFKLAHSLLDQNEFKNPLGKKEIESFFGKFESFGTPQIDAPQNTISLLYKKNKNTYISRYFTFDINSQNKITNISEFKVQ